MEGIDNRTPARETNENSNAFGLTQRSINHMFQRIEDIKSSESTRHYSVFVSFLQIYNEKVFDLLNP